MAELTVTDQELLELFDKIDCDGSGSIDLDEMNLEYRQKGFSDAEIKEIFQSLDTNNDGKITKEEYKIKLKIIPAESRRRACWRKVFEESDTNGDGFLTTSEFMASLKKFNLAEGISEEDLKRFVKGIDANGDDKIDYEEYLKWITGGK